MPIDLESQILTSLRALTAADRPATFNHLARQFGVSAQLVASIGRRLVEAGDAEASYATIHGQRTMFGLLPQPARPAAPIG